MEKKKIIIKIGLECHVKIKTKKKIFSPSNNELETDMRDLAIPGCLPIINKKAIKIALKTCLIFKSKINKNLKFDRKHYIYKDLPKGYQITQYNKPIGVNGEIKLKKTKIKIKKIQIEEDTSNMKYKKKYTKLNYKRSGNPLLEIVTSPSFKNCEQTKKFIKLIKKKLKKHKISDCKASLGEFRTDVNISVNYNNIQHKKIEIKNLNSCKKIINCIKYETKNQIKEIKRKKNKKKETKKWDNIKKKTIKTRNKSSSKHYKFIEDKNFPIFKIDKKIIKKIKKEIKKTKKEDKLYKKMFNKKELNALKKNKKLEILKKITKKKKDLKKNSTFLINKLPDGNKKKINYKNLKKIIKLYYKKKITNEEIKELSEFIYSKKSINLVIKNKTINNKKNVENEIKKIINLFPEIIEKYKKGKENLINFLIGKVLKEIKINPEIIKLKINKIIKQENN